MKKLQSNVLFLLYANNILIKTADIFAVIFVVNSRTDISIYKQNVLC